MDFVFILFFILSFFIVTFALLHLLAAGAALLKGDKTTGNILIFVGALIALPAIPLLAMVQWYAEFHLLHGLLGQRFAAWEPI